MGRAELEDGMDVLDLGCGWGSLSLWIAANYPKCRVTAVSNSHSQRQFIQDRCRKLGLNNVEVRTCNIAQLELDEKFDRVLSVEMFEHVRNYQLLLHSKNGPDLPRTSAARNSSLFSIGSLREFYLSAHRCCA